ncbi:MFS transporter [Amycolatopsis sp. NPDC102389]|uniref:MFS transporter n=1 Tax=Amycolatopsis sp. NPDC102389 TaxID=3363941 RepID=UPI0037F377E4
MLQIAFAVNLIGSSVGAVAYPLFVLAATGDIAFTGTVVTVSVVASIVTGLFMGPLLDRWGLRLSWLVSMAVGSVVTALTFVLDRADSLSWWMLLVLAFIRSAADEPGRVATFGLLPALAAESGKTLERANATLRGLNSMASLFGPVVAGVVVGLLGSPMTLLIDAAAGAIAALIVLFFLATPHNPVSDLHEDKSSYYRQFRVALRFFWNDRILRALIGATTLFAALDTGLATIGLTAYASDQIGSPAWYGGLISSFGAGSLVGTILYGVFGHRIPRRAAYLTAYLGLAALILLLTLDIGVAVALVLMFVAGVVISPVDLLYMLVLQERVPQRMFGRVTSIATTVVSAPSPVAVSLLSWLLATTGTRHTFVVLGFCYLGFALALFFVRPLRGMQAGRRS